jgi:hypothetical protein
MSSLQITITVQSTTTHTSITTVNILPTMPFEHHNDQLSAHKHRTAMTKSNPATSVSIWTMMLLFVGVGRTTKIYSDQFYSDQQDEQQMVYSDFVISHNMVNRTDLIRVNSQRPPPKLQGSSNTPPVVNETSITPPKLLNNDQFRPSVHFCRLNGDVAVIGGN